MLEVWFEFSEGRKAVYMKMENKMFSKQMFSGCTETVGHRTELEKKKPSQVSPSLPYLVHAIVIYDSFLEKVPCLHSLGS